MKHRQFSIRGILLLMFAIAITYPVWTEWYENAVARSMVVPTNHNGFRKMSPFTAVSFENDLIDVKVNGTSYELLAINGVKTDHLMRIAAIAFDNALAEKRFAEDLPAVLNAAGMKGTKDTVELTVLDRRTGETLVIPDCPMTRENRSMIYRVRSDKAARR